MNPTVGLVSAVSINGVYGEGAKIPWDIPEDLKHFKKLTTLWTVVMGWRTWESLPRHPLPHRENIVITRNNQYEAKGAKVCSSIKHAMASVSTAKMFFIGGKSIWYEAMDYADEAWVTIVKREYPITHGVTHTASELLNPPAHWPNFSFDEIVVDEDSFGDIPGFKIVRFKNTKRKA